MVDSLQPAPEARSPVEGARWASRSEERAQAIAEFLEVALAGGAIVVADLQERARAAGLLGAGQKITNSKTFKAAKKKLGITSCRDGFGCGGEWFWALPISPKTTLLETPTGLAPKVARVSPQTTTSLEEPPLFEWIEGVARLDPADAPRDVPPHRWRQFVDDCKAFLSEQWAERAVEMGWDAASLFGCSPVRPFDHLGRAGLLWNMVGGKLTRLYPDWAVISAADGAERVFHRRPSTTKVTLPWRLR